MNGERENLLFNLLPEIYRLRDAETGGVLRALTAVMDREYRQLENDIQGLYENWFVETCESWVLPYLGELLGIRTLADARANIPSQRRFVANTILYRRSKGVPAVLENVAEDVTGWKAFSTDYFRFLGWTQNVRHPRPELGTYVDVRDEAALANMHKPSLKLSRRPDVRPIRPAKRTAVRGLYNLPNAGIYFSRLMSYRIAGGTPGTYATRQGCYTIDPAGYDTPLFIDSPRRSGVFQEPRDQYLPLPLNARLLAAKLRDLRAQGEQAKPNAPPPVSEFYGPDRGIYIYTQKTVGDPFEPVDAKSVTAMDLSKWMAPSAGLAIDVERGRLCFAQPPHKVRVDYNYGFSANLGAGPYVQSEAPIAGEWVGHVISAPTSEPNSYSSLEEALAARPGGQPAVVRILDNSLYTLSGDLPLKRSLRIEVASGMRPAVRITSGASVTGPDGSVPAELALGGLFMIGTLSIGGTLELKMENCTLIPPASQPAAVSLICSSSSPADYELLHVDIHNCIIGPIQLPDGIVGLKIDTAIVDDFSAYNSGVDHAIGTATAGPPMELRDVTVFGKVNAKSLRASNVIFTQTVMVRESGPSYARFSYLPNEGALPRYRCAPAKEAPLFSSAAYGDSVYAQLGDFCPESILTGAEDGSEMGAFRNLYNNRRLTNLKMILEEYLPAGMEAGWTFLT